MRRKVVFEVDFDDLNQYKNMDLIPVFMQIDKECFDIALTRKQAEKAWTIFQKIFYFKLYEKNSDYVNNLVNVRLFNNKFVVFSNSDNTFKNNNKYTGNDTAAKIAENVYVVIMQNSINNLVILKKCLIDCNVKRFKLFVADINDFNNALFKEQEMFRVLKWDFVMKLLFICHYYLIHMRNI